MYYQMAYMFFDATAFNQDLCDFGDNFSQISNNAVNIFMDSGCSNENTPTSAIGTWCAVTTCALQLVHSPQKEY